MSDSEREQNTLQQAAAASEELMKKVEALEGHSKALEKRLHESDEGLRKESVLRKKLQFEIEDMKGAIRVYCRCRPLSGSELQRGDDECVRFPDQFTARLEHQSKGISDKLEEKTYEFDHVFSPLINGSQDDIFEQTKGLANFAADGYNVCVFAYGQVRASATSSTGSVTARLPVQTGSGKTFTMAGTPEMPGLKPRFVREIFDIATRSKQYTFRIRAYMLEIYLDELLDLFWKKQTKNWKKELAAGKAPALKVQKNAKGIVVVSGAVEHEFESAQELLDFVDDAEKHRVVGTFRGEADALMVTRSCRKHGDECGELAFSSHLWDLYRTRRPQDEEEVPGQAKLG